MILRFQCLRYRELIISCYRVYYGSSVFVLSGVFFIATMSFAAMAVLLSTIIASVASKGKHRRAIPAWLSQVSKLHNQSVLF